jgi:Leucine-rich repeat (LRR) protein
LQLHGLKKLRVTSGSVTPETLRQIAKQTDLEELYLQDTQIRNIDLAEILPKLSQLQRLTLRSCNNITDHSVESIISLPKLRLLALIRMNLTRQGLEKIVESKRITALDLRQCSQLLPEDYSLLIRMPQLTDLKIAGFSIDDSVLEIVTQLPELHGLTIEDTMISPDGFAGMTANPKMAEKLTSLVLARNSTLFDASLETLKNFHRLKRLSVNSMMITGEFLNALAAEESKRPKLEILSLEKSLLTPEGVTVLKKFRELKSLNLSGVALSQELAEIIATQETLEIINLSECQLDNEMLKTIRNMKSVKTLILAGNPLIQE